MRKLVVYLFAHDFVRLLVELAVLGLLAALSIAAEISQVYDTGNVIVEAGIHATIR